MLPESVASPPKRLTFHIEINNLASAHSSPKCNRVDDSRPVGLEVERAWEQAQLGRQFPAQRFAWLGVVVQSDGVQIGLTVLAQVGALGQGAAQQAVDE